MNVKICGVTRLEDARLALEAGAWALGFILHPRSPRYLEPEAIARIVAALPAEALTIGVSVDLPLEELSSIVERTGLRGVQLHGAEPPDYAEAVRAGLVIKAFRVGPGFDVACLDAYPRQLILLDAYHPAAPGGTGVSFDWSVASTAARKRPIVLAGGIRPGNVAECIRVARPSAIDVSSGVESSPGTKDPRLIDELFAAVRRAEEQQPESF